MANVSVGDGQSSTSATVSAGETFTVLAGGTASATTVDSGGGFVVSSGGFALTATVLSGGSAIIGGYDLNMLVSSGGSETVLAGANTTGTVLSGGGEFVSSGGIVSASTVYDSGTETIFASGTAIGTSVGLGAVQIVSSGGFSEYSVISGVYDDYFNPALQTTEIVSAGGKTLFTQLYDFAQFDVLAGASATSTIVGLGYEHVASGGTDSNSIVDGGAQYVSAGAMVGGTTVSGGGQILSSGVTVTGTVLTDKGDQSILFGATGIDTTMSGFSGSGAAIYAYGVASGATVVSGGIAYIEAGGSAVATTLGYSGTELVSSGGTATGTTLGSASLERLLTGGAVSSVVVDNGGLQIVSSGASAAGTTLNAGGIQLVLPGANVSGDVFSGGTVVSTGVFVTSGTTGTALLPVVVSGTVLATQTEYVLNGGVAIGTTVSSGGGLLNVEAGGATTGTILASGVFVSGGMTAIGGGGLEVVSSGGSAISSTVYSGAALSAVSGTQAGSVLSGGEDFVSGGTVYDTNLIAGFLEASSGATVNDTSMSGDGGFGLSAGATASGITATGGAISVQTGAAANVVTLSTGASLTVSSGGSASDVTVNSGSSVTVGTAAVFVDDGVVGSGGGVVTSVSISSGGIETVGSGGIAYSTTVESGGVVDVTGAGALSGSVVSNGGQENIQFGYIEFSEFPTFSITSVAAAAITTDVTIDGGTVSIASGSTASGYVMFGAGAGTLNLADATPLAATISGFAAGDVIDLTGVTYAAGGSAVLSPTDMLSVTDGGTSINLQFDNTVVGETFKLSADATGSGTDIALAVNPCFAAGTRILTVRGEIPVEALNPGDRVITFTGEEREVVWIGHREIDIARHPKPEAVRPIVIEPDALADGVPTRRLALSPDHGLYIDQLLVQPKDLLNGATIRPDTAARRVRYFHVELTAHDILFAEGAPAESFLDTGHRGVFDNAAEPLLLHPDLMQIRREAEGRAPLCLGGEALSQIRARLAARRRGTHALLRTGVSRRGNAEPSFTLP